MTGKHRILWLLARISPRHSRQDKTLWSLDNSLARWKKKEKSLSGRSSPHGRGLLTSLIFFTRRTSICSTGVAPLSLSSPLPRVSFSPSSSPPGLFFDTDSELCSLCLLPSWMKGGPWLTDRGFPHKSERSRSDPVRSDVSEARVGREVFKRKKNKLRAAAQNLHSQTTVELIGSVHHEDCVKS